MMGQLVAKGHELTPHPDQADVLVVNTCSFIDPAKKESVDTILEMAEYKKIGRAQQADRRRLPGGTLPRRYPPGNARSGRPHRHQRARQHRRGLRRTGAPVRSAGALPLPRPHPARARHAAPLRLHEDRRGLRSPLHLLRDPAISRRLPQPPLRIRDLRGHPPLPAGHPRNQPDRPGHHLLRRGSRTPGRAGRSARAPGRKSRPRTKSGSVSSTPIRTRSPRTCSTPSPHTPPWSSTSTCRCSMPAPAF